MKSIEETTQKVLFCKFSPPDFKVLIVMMAMHTKSVQFTLNEPNYKKKQLETKNWHHRFSVGVIDIVE